MHIYEKKGRYIIDFQDIPSKRANMPEIPVEERKSNFKEVETGFPEDVAVSEAKRCLSCRRCLGCALCWAECKPEAICFDLPDKYIDLTVDKVILTPGVERRTAPISGNIFNKHMNVVTDLQVERMLAATGPSNGLILRPQDGEIPRSIAFVQTFGTADEKMGDSILIFGINEAIMAQKKMKHVKIRMISPTMEAFRTRFAGSLEKVSGIDFVNATVSTASETSVGGNIDIKYQVDGSEQTERFDLVVLLTLPELPSEIENVAKRIGVKLDYGSFPDNPGRIVETDTPGVVLA